MSGSLLRTRQAAVWAALVLMTLASWCAGHGIGSARGAGVTVLVIALVKAALVIREFMEVRHAPCWLQILTAAWIVGAAALLVGLFLRAS